MKVQSFFEDYLGSAAMQVDLLPASGSGRQNYLGYGGDGSMYIITYNEDVRENEAFFYFSEVFSSLGLNTPKVLKISEDRKLYVQTCLGRDTLSDEISRYGEGARVEALVKKALYALYQLQTKTLGKIDYTQTFEYRSYDRLPITNDLFYFKSFIVDVLGLKYHKATLLQEFDKLVDALQSIEPRGLMMRDFQSRNIMVNSSDEVYFIDYQSAMHGPLMYDVVSMLYQAKANFSETFKEKMLAYYYGLFSEEREKQWLSSSLPYMKLIRFIQVLGAYGLRGLVQRKPHFLQSLPYGIENLYQHSIRWEGMAQYPELRQVVHQLWKVDLSRI